MPLSCMLAAHGGCSVEVLNYLIDKGVSFAAKDKVLVCYPSPTRSVCKDTLVGECVS